MKLSGKVGAVVCAGLVLGLIIYFRSAPDKGVAQSPNRPPAEQRISAEELALETIEERRRVAVSTFIESLDALEARIEAYEAGFVSLGDDRRLEAQERARELRGLLDKADEHLDELRTVSESRWKDVYAQVRKSVRELSDALGVLE